MTKNHSNQSYLIEGLEHLAISAKQIYKRYCKPGNILLFRGELGAGKTTLISALLSCEGFNQVSSPTYAIVNSYDTGKHTWHHFDFYRIGHMQEALDLGFDEYIDQQAIVLIEWPSKIEALLPSNCINVSLLIQENGSRLINISNASC